MNKGKKFDICLMNPPYNAGKMSGNYKSGEYSIESDFVNKLNKISNNVIAIYPFARWMKREKLSKENSTGGHLKELELLDAHKIFNIATHWKYVSIYVYDNKNIFNDTLVIADNKEYKVESYNNLKNIQDLGFLLQNPYISLKPIIDIKESIYNTLIEKYKTMVNDGHGFIYEENRFKRGARFGVDVKNKIQKSLSRVKTYLKEGTYKYCLYKGSFNNAYAEVQEWKGQDPDKLFKGQICWLTNKENVKNNIKYWMECPLFDLWRRYKFSLNNGVADGMYGNLPALDFDQDETKFREYVDSLNDFTNEEIDILVKNKIHNAEKL